MDKETVIENAMAIEGLITEEECGILYDKIQGLKTILEIGSYKGRSSYIFASVCDKLDCIDVFDLRKGEKRKEYKPHTVAELINNLLGTKATVEVHKGMSLEIMKCLKDQKCEYDMIFLDGDHSKDNVLKEHKLAMWMTSFIMGHDLYDSQVQQGVEEFNYITKSETIQLTKNFGLYEINL